VLIGPAGYGGLRVEVVVRPKDYRREGPNATIGPNRPRGTRIPGRRGALGVFRRDSTHEADVVGLVMANPLDVLDVDPTALQDRRQPGERRLPQGAR
jgi:hypothetical protein